jgi:acyl-CoA thioesterase II
VADSLESLLKLLDLEVIEVDLFRGPAPDTSLQRVFGGQVAAQALVAAGRTVESPRQVHSLHAYFLRPGDPSRPIVYEVDRTRDGRSFSTRRVAALQHGRPIFTMSASFQIPEEGLEHQVPMPEVPDPETLDRPPGPELERWRAIDLRFAGPDTWTVDDPDPVPPGQWVWFRAAEPLPDDPLLHVCVLAYASDLTLLSSTLRRHGVSRRARNLQMASMDHAMWFHRPFRADEWLLYDQFSPSASGARGLASGRIFASDGRLVASVMQEGLIRFAPSEDDASSTDT